MIQLVRNQNLKCSLAFVSTEATELLCAYQPETGCMVSHVLDINLEQAAWCRCPDNLSKRSGNNNNSNNDSLISTKL